jgi:hypothetical protein
MTSNKAEWERGWFYLRNNGADLPLHRQGAEGEGRLLASRRFSVLTPGAAGFAPEHAGVKNLPPLKGISSRDSKKASKRQGLIPNSFHILQASAIFFLSYYRKTEDQERPSGRWMTAPQ